MPSRAVPDGYSLALVTEADLDELLPLMRAYCDFYETAPSDGDLLALSRAVIGDPEHEGVQLIARDAHHQELAREAGSLGGQSSSPARASRCTS